MNTENEIICSTGALFSIPDLRDYVASASPETTYPEEFELTMPEIKNQGAVGSCVAHALATAAEYFNSKELNTTLKLSTGYIYGNRILSSHKGSGMYVSDALKTMTKYGDVLYEDFPYNVEVPYAIEKFDDEVDNLVDKGINYRFESYFKLKDVNATKAHLFAGNPVIFSMRWFDDIKIVKGKLQTQEKVSKKTGGHCMVIYGWTPEGWLVQNSWGKAWGNKGTFILPYNVTTKEKWGVLDANSTSTLNIKKPFKSKIGAFFAKTVHKVISWFYNLKYKIQNKS